MKPDTVIAEPGMRVWPAILYCPAALGVMACPAIVRIDPPGVTIEERAEVIPFITIAEAEGVREIAEPETVITEPGASV